MAIPVPPPPEEILSHYPSPTHTPSPTEGHPYEQIHTLIYTDEPLPDVDHTPLSENSCGSPTRGQMKRGFITENRPSDSDSAPDSDPDSDSDSSTDTAFYDDNSQYSEDEPLLPLEYTHNPSQNTTNNPESPEPLASVPEHSDESYYNSDYVSEDHGPARPPPNPSSATMDTDLPDDESPTRKYIDAYDYTTPHGILFRPKPPSKSSRNIN